MKLTKDDVWGTHDEQTFELLTTGMVVARGLPEVDGVYMKQEDYDRITIKRPAICPVWGDVLPYKSVTAISCLEQQDGVEYWLEYVHGGGAIEKTKNLPDGKVAIRSNYMCW